MSEFTNAPIIVNDFRVAVYQIYHQYQFIKANLPAATASTWLKATWAITLNRGFTGLPYFPHTVVVVDDSSPYWREAYLRERGFPEYKGGRPSKTDEWYEVNQAGLDYVTAPNSPIHYLKFPQFEADDIASAIVRSKSNRLVFLHTIDSDWMGLVNNGVLNSMTLDQALLEPFVEPTSLWVSMAQWTPRFRDEAGVFAHTLKREKRKIDSPPQIWDIKVEKGDKSDNLIKGSPIEVINLLNPPPEFDILQRANYALQVRQVVNSGEPNSSFKHLKKAHDWFVESGQRVTVHGYYDFLSPELT